MLCLTRKPGQSIVIGEDVVITVLENRHGAIRLGIQAPRSVPVLRGEMMAVVEEITVSNREAAGMPSGDSPPSRPSDPVTSTATVAVATEVAR